MKTRLTFLACFVIAAGFVSTASADEPGHPDVIPPLSCKLQEDQLATCSTELDASKTGLETCLGEQDMLIDWARKQCPNLQDLTNDQIKEHARTDTDPPKKTAPPKKRRPSKDKGHKPKPPTTSKVKVEILVPLYGESEPVAPNATCANGSFRLPVGFDRNGNKKLDADEVLDTLQSGCNGKDGAPGKPGKNGAAARTTSERFDSDPACPAGGTRSTHWTDFNGNGLLDGGEASGDAVLCDGKSGNSGRPGRNGATRVQFGLGLRASAIWSNDRPVGYSAAPEAQLELWLSPVVEFVTGIAWAPEGDRNMVVTAQVRRRALNKRVGIGLGVQYQAWNLEGNKALWQTVTVAVCGQLVLVEGDWVDVSADACLLGGLDGYDEDAQAAGGGSTGLNASLKF